MLVASDGEVEKIKGLDSVCILDYWSVCGPPNLGAAILWDQ